MGQGDLECANEALEAVVDVGGQAEAAACLEGDEAVQRGSKGAGRVDGVVVCCQVVAGQDGGDDVERPVGRRRCAIARGRWVAA